MKRGVSVKKIISVMLTAVMLIAALPVMADSGNDEDKMALLAELDIMVGDDDGNLRLDDNVSRAEFAKFNGKNVLLWSKNSSIMSLESLEKDAVILAENVSNGCANSFELLESESGNNAIVYSDTDSDNKTSVYVMYRDNETGKFSSAVKLVTSDNYIESPSVIYEIGRASCRERV